METPAALPPAGTSSASGAEEGFSMSAHADGLANAAKQDYSKQWEEAPKTEPPPSAGTDAPGGAGHGAGSGTSDSPNDAVNEESARTILSMYDTLTGIVCEAMVNRPNEYPAERFHMKPALRRDAEKQLAKGLAKSGSFEVPWYVALLFVLILGMVPNILLIRQLRRNAKAAAKAAKDNPQRAADGQVIAPTTITDKEGRIVAFRPATSPTPAQAARQRSDVKVYGECAVCGKPLHKPRRTYCSQSCAGQGTNRKRAERAATEQATEEHGKAS